MSYVNIKRKFCVAREGAGMSQKELVEYANKKQNGKTKEINVAIDKIKRCETQKAAIPVEILVLYAEVGKCLPSWFIDDSKESEWKNFLFKQKYGEEWVYRYDVNGNLKKAIERYCAEENISIASFCNDDWFTNKSSIGKLMGGENGKINIEDAGRISEILKISFDELLLGEKEIINEIEKDAIAMMLVSEKTRMKEKSLEEINRYAKTMKYLPSRIIDDSKESGIRNWFFREISGEKDLYKDNITEFIGEK
jgi:transcriptional regulator with XRE-family HTH domain